MNEKKYEKIAILKKKTTSPKEISVTKHRFIFMKIPLTRLLK